MTLDEIPARNALRFPHKPAFIMGEVRRTWAEVDARVTRLAHALSDAGLRAGDRVAVLLPNCPEYFEIYFGCARAGVIAVPLNYRLTARELTQILSHAEPALLVVGAEYLPQARELKKLLPAVRRYWVLGEGSLDGAGNYRQLLSAAGTGPVHALRADTDPCAIFYTSGTTGLPKGAMVSHLNLEMNGYNQMIADASRHDDINLVSTPIYHVGAVFVAVTYMMLGCAQVIVPRFEPGLWLQTTAASRATVALLIPTMINAVLHHPGCDQTDLSALRLIFYGGGPMPPAVLERAMKRLHCGFTQGYGLTETLEATFLTSQDHVLGGTALQQKRLGSAGREAVGAEVRIVDDAGRDLGVNEIGEILVRSRSVIAGYWNMPDETRQAIRERWFHTGDLGYLDEERYLFLVDRKKDMVVSGGVNIYSKEIEAVLYQHPAVLEAAIIGLPDEEWGESVTAVIAKKPGSEVSAAEITEHCRATLAGYKKPRRVFFLPELPKNPSGKILKRELRMMLAGSPAGR
ncbi:MAG: long-chain-fatty-acid--CoA ligase [Gammaproteobacteria bacterium]|nr:long-chain-fatty-acid--CoA ligase [Gammaproteobacteria bacterium]